jgi:hypothetical protein
MVRGGEQKEALELVRTLRGCGFKLRISAYSAALLATIKEQEQVRFFCWELPEVKQVFHPFHSFSV